MSISTTTEAEVNMLLVAYKQLVTNQIFDTLMQKITPKIRKAAEDAATQLRPQIEARFDPLSRDLLVKISVQGY